MKTLKQFQHEMWLQNCDERAAWSMPVLTEEDYCEQNGAYLANEYAEEKRDSWGFSSSLERFLGLKE